MIDSNEQTENTPTQAQDQSAVSLENWTSLKTTHLKDYVRH